MSDPRWQTVREALTWSLDEHDYDGTENPLEFVRAALAALDSLEDEMEQARDAVQRHYELSVEAIRRGEAAEVEVERLREWADQQVKRGDDEQIARKKAEAENERLREALRRIQQLAWDEMKGEIRSATIYAHARAALGGEE